MHQPFNKGHGGHALISIDDKSEPILQPIHILIQCFMGELDYFKETVRLLRLLELQSLRLSELS